MRELNVNEIKEVNGGILHFFAVLGAAEFAYEFFAGVDEGLGEG